MHSLNARDLGWKCIFRANSSLLPQGFDVRVLIPQGLIGSPLNFGFLNNLLTFINCESLKEIGGMACVMPARSSRGQTLNSTSPQSTPPPPPSPLPPPLVQRTIVIVITELFTKGWRHKHLRGKRGNTDMLQEKFIHSDTEQLLMVKYFIIA